VSGHNALKELAEGNWDIKDPGTGNALPRDQAGIVNIVTGASGETNTLAAPAKPGIILGLTLKTDGGGDRVVTVASAYDGAGGRTTITLATAGDFIVLISRVHGSGYRWDVLSENLSANATQAELNAVADGITATAAEVNNVADRSENIVTCTASTLAVTEVLHHNKTIVLDRADGIAVTLPTAAAGLNFEFIVKTTFTSAASIKSVAGTDIMIGHAIMGNNTDNTVVNFQAVAGSTYDTIDMLGTGNSTGGMAGQRVRIKGLAANLWYVEIIGDAAGNEATPFADTVA
jgi:hypothetical protein